MTYPETPLSPEKLDLRTILEVPLRQFVLWLVIVLVVAFAGQQPGVVCITPMAWLIALRVGIVCVIRSPSKERANRLIEAALAGAFLGLLEGALFWVIAPLAGPLAPDEKLKTVIISAIMVGVGIVAGAIMSLFTAYMFERRRGTA